MGEAKTEMLNEPQYNLLGMETIHQPHLPAKDSYDNHPSGHFSQAEIIDSD
jgi:hypothetical protein